MRRSRSAVDTALGDLSRRDFSSAELDRRLGERGFDERERDEALVTLRRTGLLDDERYAASRAASLAARGAGDALIRHDLERVGVPRELADTAIESLEDEALRARRIVERRGAGPKTARYLVSKGFADEAISACLAG